MESLIRSGDKLTKGDICGFLKEFLLPVCTLVTPNLPEVVGYCGILWIDVFVIETDRSTNCGGYEEGCG